MKRLHAILSILLVGFIAVGWVIKDTANPVDIYTGSNTTPTIDAATNGTVTLGPTSSTVSHVVNGQLSTTTAGTATNSFASSGGVSQVFVQSGSSSFGAYSTYRRGATSFGEMGTDSTKTGLYFGTYNPSFAYVGDISLAGAWTLGNSTPQAVTHTAWMTAGNYFRVASNSSQAAPNGVYLSPGDSADNGVYYVNRLSSTTSNGWNTRVTTDGSNHTSLIFANDDTARTTVGALSLGTKMSIDYLGAATIGPQAAGATNVQKVNGGLVVNSTNNTPFSVISNTSSATTSATIGSHYSRLTGPSAVATFTPNISASGMPAGFVIVGTQTEGSGAGNSRSTMYQVAPGTPGTATVVGTNNLPGGMTIAGAGSNSGGIVISNTNSNTIDVAVTFLGFQ